MGESERYQEYKVGPRSRFSLGQPSNALFTLLAINIVFFFLILLSKVFFLFANQGQGAEALSNSSLIEWFALPASLKSIAAHPWTLLTFMFSHYGGQQFQLLFTFFSNMLWLWTFTFILQDISGNRFIFPVYIYGSLIAAVFFILAVHIIPAFKPFTTSFFLYGSSFGVTAIAAAVATLSPNYRLLKNIGNGIPVWVLTVGFLFISLIFNFSFTNPNYLAILGAALAGFIFVQFLHKGIDLSEWMHRLFYWASNLFSPNIKKQEVKIKEKIFYETGNRTPFTKTANITQQRIDEILDKISQHGFNHLSDEEKNILKRASEQDFS